MYYSLSVCIINVQGVLPRFGFDLDISPTHSIVGLCSPLYYYALINDFEYFDKLYALFESDKYIIHFAPYPKPLCQSYFVFSF